MKNKKTENYLVDGMLNNKFELKELKEQFTNKDIKIFVVFGVAAIASLATLSSPAVCVSIASIATVIASYEYKSARKCDNTEARLEQENKHIDRLLNGEIKEDERLINKRKKKLISLSKLREEKEKDLDFQHTLSNVIYGVTAASSLAVACFGGVSYELILPLIGVAASAMVSNAEIKKHKECEVVENRINNLIRDLGVDSYEKEKEEKIHYANIMQGVYQETKELEKGHKVYKKVR